MEVLQKLMIIRPQRAQGYRWVFIALDPGCRVEVSHKVSGVGEEEWLGLSPKMDKRRY